MKTKKTRIEMCEVISFVEGTEIADAIGSLLDTRRALGSIGAEDKAEVVLTYAEELCKDYIEWCIDGDGDYLEDIPDNVFKHFMGMTKKKYMATDHSFVVGDGKSVPLPYSRPDELENYLL